MLVKHCFFAALVWVAQVFAADKAVLPVAKHESQGIGLNTSFIVGGTSTTIQIRPFMAHIGYQSGKTYEPQCGASILDKRHILCAAHCFENRKLSYRVRVGSTKWASGGQLVAVSKIFVHPEYNKAAPYDYDVAVLRLSKDLVFGPTVKAVTLVPVNQRVATNTEITIIGWGYTDALKSNPLPAGLREVKIETVAHSDCEGLSLSAPVTNTMFCAMGVEKDACFGDSGGPVYNDKTKQQMGLVSWSMGCAQIGSPTVFTDLANPSIRSFIAKSQKQ